MKHYYITEEFCKENNFQYQNEFIGYSYTFNELKIYYDSEIESCGYSLNKKELESYSNPEEEEEKIYTDEFVREYLTEESAMKIKKYLNQFNIELKLEADEF